MPSVVAEDYLETIYNLAMEGEPVIAARLAEKFGVSRPTVSESLKRLTADGYIEIGAGHAITLTPQGRTLTEGVLRRHRLAERLLFDLLGMDWISAHEQAHALEHWLSPEVAERISTLLGNPQTCPHGNPIPGNASSAETYLREQQAFRLADAAPGSRVRVVLISEVVEDETEVLRRLADTQIYPHSRLTIRGVDPGGLVVFEAGDGVHTVPGDLAGKIWVATEESPS